MNDAAANGTPVPPYRRIAEVLCEEIDGGRYPAGHKIPTQQSLVRRFGVSRATIQRALLELRERGYIDSQQGSGSYVLDPGQSRPGPKGVELSEHIATAFQARHVALDAFCITSETLNSAVQGSLWRIRNGEIRPDSIALRLLLPSLSTHLAVPQRVGAPEDPRPLQRLRQLMRSQAVTLESSFGALKEHGLVSDVSVAIRSVPLTPMQKLYVLNGTDVLSGYYRVVERSITIANEEMDIYDVFGLTATLFHHSSARNPHSAEYVIRSKEWFDSLWSTIAQPLTLLE